MKRAAIGVVAIGMVFATVAPIQANHKHKQARAYPRPAPAATFDQRWAWLKSNEEPGHTKLCTYMGGPKSSLWSCR